MLFIEGIVWFVRVCADLFTPMHIVGVGVFLCVLLWEQDFGLFAAEFQP